MSTRNIRKFITAPDGRHYSGRWPQQMPCAGEGPYTAAMARRVNGACEVVIPLGRIDVATNEVAIEVEPVGSWRHGARQVLAYAAQTGQQPALALFGKADYLPIYLFLRDRFPAFTLWIWRGAWVRTTNRREAALRTVGRQPPPPDRNVPPVTTDPVLLRVMQEVDPTGEMPEVDRYQEALRRHRLTERLAAARAEMAASRAQRKAAAA